MLIKTNELIGSALDWAVAKCEGGVDFLFDGITFGFTLNGKTKVLAGKPWATSMRFVPSTDWSQGGPIIEREKIGYCWSSNGYWHAYQFDAEDDLNSAFYQTGPTPLIAAMRCYVASKMGEEVDVPTGFLK